MSSAVSICAKDGARPPLPKNTRENTDLLAFFVSNRNRSQDNFALDLSNLKTEGKFLSSTGQQASFTNWHQNEPDNKNGQEHFVTMWDDGKWNDFPGNYSSAVIICQRDCLEDINKEEDSSGRTFPVTGTVKEREEELKTSLSCGKPNALHN